MKFTMLPFVQCCLLLVLLGVTSARRVNQPAAVEVVEEPSSQEMHQRQLPEGQPNYGLTKSEHNDQYGVRISYRSDIMSIVNESRERKKERVDCIQYIFEIYHSSFFGTFLFFSFRFCLFLPTFLLLHLSHDSTPPVSCVRSCCLVWYRTNDIYLYSGWMKQVITVNMVITTAVTMHAVPMVIRGEMRITIDNNKEEQEEEEDPEDQ